MAANRIVAIVDDDEAVRTATVSLVRSLGHKVRSFASAEEFLSHGDDEGVDCLVTDVHMPGMDGFVLYNRLVERGRTYPVVFVTGFLDESTRANILAAGAFCYLGKPFSGDQLVDCLQRALGEAPH
ncbi:MULTISPECIES: response regulator [unclassified Luteibacter]|uniref:response regulator transcription factor n=1 Tax=unclassified Luteibacter TaxID=2620188 RepID=UPI0008C4F703|nr:MULTISPECIES: response regulator [unclassified Luteibacter]MDR6938250.1 FixJ family two-component response regulator [Luteibacter sp. 3190]SEW05908.1 Response regulator receiver domain-containing protein [Luteibacter sp. 329MFSha]